MLIIPFFLRATKQNHAFSEVVPKGLVQKYRFSDPLSLVRMWLTSQLQKPGAELGRRKNFARTKMTYFSEKIPFWRQKFLMTLLSSQEKHLFYSFRAHNRQHYFSKYWGEDECMGHPPTSNFGGTVPPVRLGFRLCYLLSLWSSSSRIRHYYTLWSCSVKLVIR